MNDLVMARKIKMETNGRCDFCHGIIPVGRYGSEVRGEGVKAQGLYHGKECYDAAREHYEQMQGEEGIEDDKIV